jgi:16S rRNA (cytidine1402-2'-O)-methyltransferase
MLIETPYRNGVMLQALLQTLKHNTRLSVSSQLTLHDAQTISDSVKNWHHKTVAMNNAIPAVFAIGR